MFPADFALWVCHFLLLLTTSSLLVREMDLGYKYAGLYLDHSKAAYWDGRNSSGQEVSSGIYFYTILAGEFTATKKMIVVR